MTGPFEETSQGTPEPSQSQEPAQPEQRSRRGVIAAVAGLTALVVLFALLFAAFNNRSIVSGGAPPTPTIPTGWQRYTDPGSYFTLTIPNGWTAKRETGTATMGNSSGSATVHTEMEALGGPPDGQNTITVFIDVEPITNDFTRHWWCQNGWPQNTTLAGLPAFTGGNGMWIVNSSGAHFQINYAYPNYKGDVLMTANSPSPTPMPPGFYEKGQQELHTILASFTPTPDSPLKCT